MSNHDASTQNSGDPDYVDGTDIFPHPVYAQTVLAPLFDGVKQYFAADMDRINQAHLVMLAETEILAAKDAARIAGALREIIAETDPTALSYEGEYEDYFFLTEHLLRSKLGDLGGALHTARSRNDMDHTLFRLALLRRGEALLSDIRELAQVISDTAEREAETLIVAYTHGQPAQPSTYGHYLSATLETLLRDAARLDSAIANVDHCPMGAAAITTTGFPIDRGRVASLLGFEGATLNSYGSIAWVDYITGLYSAIKLVFLHLGRLVQDFAFWSAFEVGQLRVPDALVQVSSIMPQKRNPVPIEHMRHLASVTAGRCDMIMDTMHNTPFTDMNDSEGAVQEAGFAAFETGSRMLRLLAAFVASSGIEAAHVQRNADAACVTITELADTLVRTSALSFRQAHEIAAATARAVIDKGVSLSAGYDDFSQACGGAGLLDRAAFAEAVSMRGFVTRRDRRGGPAPQALRAARADYARKLNDLRKTARVREERRSSASAELVRAFESL